MATFGDPAKGIVRFDFAATTATRLAEATEFIDLTIGLDGLLYALSNDETAVHVYEPSTLAPLRSFELANGCRGIAVNAAGHVFGASWDGRVCHFTPEGSLVTSIASGAINLSDIDLNDEAQLG